eukprot:TRINITY_DN26490_c0_g1_i1.p1 TRINITY_DN26490_c0_g1~~TRINITY_DN26490_c0_g1_i1.p1  ORF type:complete len:649 (-),score=149.48 TRINITY_DN26490_c0_g1_i1:38-1984(-)
MAKSPGPLAECPPCGMDSLLPMCRALSVASGVGAESPPAPTKPTARASSADETSQVFSVRPPRDAIAGLASGAKTLLRSVAAGTNALASGPCEGINKGDPVAALLGLAEGTASAVLFPCAGVVVGVTQCVRGVANTPSAFLESARGRQWSTEKRQWAPVAYSLREEAQELRRRHLEAKAAKEAAAAQAAKAAQDAAAAAEGTPASSANGASDDGTTEASAFDEDGQDAGRAAAGSRQSALRPDNYYRLLHVHPSASSTEIRRAYYRESRRCHPDKVGADRRAVARFQQISEAYKVLRSPELRRAYDRGGCDEVSRMATTVDLGILYSAVLSGRQWEPYVGHFALSRLLASNGGVVESADVADGLGAELDEPNNDILEAFKELMLASESTTNAWQTRREVRCAMDLAERLQPAVDGVEAAIFEHSLRQDAERLADAPFAPGLMLVMATVYESEATRFLGTLSLLDPRREIEQVRAQGRLLRCQAQAAAAGVRAAMALRALLEEEANEAGRSGATTDAGESSGEPKTTSLCLERPAVQAQLPALAAALWSLTVLDVEGTLRRVCRRILRDRSEELPARIARAKALQVTASVLRTAATARAGLPAAGLPGENEELLRDRVQEMAACLVGRDNADASAAGEAAADGTPASCV